MRIEKAIRNVTHSILYYGSILILSLVLRKVFLQYLDVELLGIEGVIGNLFSLMALVDVGTGSLITYLLYKAFSHNDKEEISILMGMYKNMYILIALIMTILSIFLVPLLPYIISVKTVDWKIVYLIYGIKCIGMLGTYFYAYRRLLFKVSQNEYICTRVDMFFSYIRYISWFAVILLWKSYILYLIFEVLCVVLANMYIAHLSTKKFPYAIGKNIKLRDYKERNFFKDMKNTYIIKIAGTIYGSTDNIVISYFLGLKSVALLSNYLIITKIISDGFNKLVSPLQGSIGNLVYTEDREKSIKVFKMFDMFAYLLGSSIVCCFICCVNEFITLWIGIQYQFNILTVFCIGISLYIIFASQFVSNFRDVYGKFELDKTYAIVGAILNLVLSISLVNYIGVAGVYIGTIFGMIGFWIGRYFVLNNELFKGQVNYLYIQLKHFATFALILAFSYFSCLQINLGILGFFIKMIICLISSVMINFLIYRNSNEFIDVKHYLRGCTTLMKSKIYKN